MIISASRRTDIPCHYSEWFMNRITAGYVLTRNPMNPAQVSRISLSPEVVDCIVFWTKDPANIIPHLRELDRLEYNYYFQFTLTPYGRDIEINLRDKTDIIDTFIHLSKKIERQRVIWRYDPIILNDRLTVEYHMEHFPRMCEILHKYTERLTISFVDMYSKLKTDLIRVITDVEIAALSTFIGKTAADYGLSVTACCEMAELTQYGIGRSSCIDKMLVEKICGCPFKLPQDKNQREGCGCVESIDIGAYNTCINGCVYCYANNSFKFAQRRHESHLQNSEILVGSLDGSVKITERMIKSNKTPQ